MHEKVLLHFLLSWGVIEILGINFDVDNFIYQCEEKDEQTEILKIVKQLIFYLFSGAWFQWRGSWAHQSLGASYPSLVAEDKGEDVAHPRQVPLCIQLERFVQNLPRNAHLWQWCGGEYWCTHVFMETWV